MRPLVSNSRGLETRLQRLRTKERSLLTWHERHLLRRQIRGLTASEAPGPAGFYRVQVDVEAGRTIQDVLDAYRRNPDVEYAELSHIVSICASPNDPDYGRQWGMSKIGGSDAWDTGQGSEQIIVAVIDTGVDYDHRDLRDNIWRNEDELNGRPGVDDDENGYVDDIYGYNFAYNNADPEDDHGHGTHCAGTIGAVGNNGLDIAGVCWHARIMSLKILDMDGNGTSADAVPAIYYAVAHGADVISMSWGGSDESRAVKDAIAYARRQGVVVVAAAGNEGSDTPFYPAGYADVVAVAATESNDRRTFLSNYGDWVDIAAPGSAIVSLKPVGSASAPGNDTFTTKVSGTSTAAPHVAGACALLLATNPLLTCEEVEHILLTMGDAISRGICASNSRLNVAKAMRAIVPVTGTVRFDQPTYSEGDEIGLLLADWNLRGAGVQSVLVGTDGDEEEEVILRETPEAKGVFRGTIASKSGGAVHGDGWLQACSGERLVIRYWDVTGDDGTARQVEAYAHADYEGSVLIQQTVETRGSAARIEVVTNEPARAEIRYADSPDGPFSLSAKGAELSDHHSIKIGRLTPGTKYYFAVILVDGAGNEAIADNEGRYYSFETGSDFAGFRVPDMYPTIQAAIDDAWSGDTIWVADGTYSGEGNIEIDFGGRAITLRSENGPQSCIIDCGGRGQAFYFHRGENQESVVEGFTISHGGNVDYGGAIRCIGSSPTIRNCIFRRNAAERCGGALCTCYGSHPTVIGCTFEENTCSTRDVLGRGGAIANRHDSSPTIQDCTFTMNSVNYAGGAMANLDSSSARVVGCTFVGNSSTHDGGAVVNEDNSPPLFAQCLFYTNLAKGDGGGLYCLDESSAALSNCVFTGNCADRDGGAIMAVRATLTVTNCTLTGNGAGRWHGGIESNGGGELHLENSIVWANVDSLNGWGSEPAQVAVDDSELVMSYCCVHGLTGTLGGIGNIGTDPLFADASRMDYHLRSQAGRWDSGRSAWTYDSQTSPCIDAGNPSQTPGDEPLTVPGEPNSLSGISIRIDMGTYGGTAKASVAPLRWSLLADMNNDRRVDWLDLAHLAADWATSGESTPGDLSRDGAVGGADLVLLGSQWRHQASSGSQPENGN